MAVLLACMVATSNGGRTSENAEVKRLGAYQASNFRYVILQDSSVIVPISETRM
jgi:hypothetical protein